ncbi:hypothetical protein O181_014414 [Austropuccinia psidii MF-1]|uniref:Uncharacterized protein n=1 Tax=Austropuccinia psidii MF-1 TaxID=1389203 RepID=A0A9Q3GPU1_9BASI|nr:hypothetical protein [Austropuccinia psidii MF-1]
MVKIIRKSAYSPANPAAEGSNDLDGEEVEVINPLVGHYSSSSPSQPPFKKFHNHIIPSTPKNFQPVLSSLPSSTPPPSPKPSTSSPFLALPMKPCPIPQPRTSPILTSHKSQPVASTSQRREAWSLLPFPATQVFQKRESWPIRVTREDPTVVNESQYSLAKLFRSVDRNSREVIVYAHDRIVLGNASEEMDSKFAWYEDELINKLQRTFDDLGKDS